MYKNRKFGKNKKSIKDTNASGSSENKRPLDSIDENASIKVAVSITRWFLLALD